MVHICVWWQIEGKVGGALLFNETARQYLLGVEDVSWRCLGDLERCHHGLTVSMWLQFTTTAPALPVNETWTVPVRPVLDTGQRGLTVVYDHEQHRLTVTARQRNRQWTVSCTSIHDLRFLPISTIESAVGKRHITHCCVSRLACSRLSGHIEPHSPRLQA